jgi:ribonucleoside-triphosphate reductase
MRTLEEIDSELKEAREALTNVEGSTAEVYSRIVGYYRSVRNWNKGKREEYGERKLYDVEGSLASACAIPAISPASVRDTAKAIAEDFGTDAVAEKLLLFVRPTCPQCPAAKTAAAKLGIPVETVDAGTESGLAEATRWTVMSTPTAILLSGDGREISRAQDSLAIGRLKNRLVQRAAA